MYKFTSKAVKTCSFSPSFKSIFQSLNVNFCVKSAEKIPTLTVKDSFTLRTHNCSEIRKENTGEVVTLCGWLDFKRMDQFAILRDGFGRTQLLFPDNMKNLVADLSLETVLKVEGTVQKRPDRDIKDGMPTGHVEVLVDKLTVLSSVKKKLPFNIRDLNKAKEALRLQYRYLDFRFWEMQRNLRERSRFIADLRSYLVYKLNFVDVETPTLFRGTPGGAQEFIVPTQMPGKFYSLVQSPQQFKQLLMIGGIDKYFQIAKCYRDESTRSDRQPEFTQLDVEMSFTSANAVMSLIEEILANCWPDFAGELNSFKKMSHANALCLYGSDKPDLRFGNQLIDCSDLIENKAAFAVVFHEASAELTKSVKNSLTLTENTLPGAKLVQSKVSESVDSWVESLSKIFGTKADSLARRCGVEKGSVVFIAVGNDEPAKKLAGRIRVEFANILEEKGLKLRSNTNEFVWIVDFPLFEMDSATNRLQSAHHPFTSPKLEDLHLLDTDPLKVRSEAYDLVFNGNEVGGGSIRIHNSELQRKILQKLSIAEDHLAYFLEALEYGCPPHGGIALGLDRLLAVMLHCKSIKDVIAFPKGMDGKDHMSGAPAEISAADKELYHLK